MTDASDDRSTDARSTDLRSTDAVRASDERADAVRADAERADAERARIEPTNDADTGSRTAAIPATEVERTAAASPPPPPPPAPTTPVPAPAPTTPAAPPTPVAAPVPTPAAAPVQTPAVADQPPRKHGNRLVATLWVLFAAGLFEAGYLLLVIALVALVDGPSVVGEEMGQFLQTPYITWLPVTLFFVLYELTVLLLGRAGRFAYVVASLIVGLLVWILTAQLLGFFQLHTLAPGADVARTLEAPYIVLIGVLAREVMLWTGYAVGARGRRVRRANRKARDEYDARQRAGLRG